MPVLRAPVRILRLDNLRFPVADTTECNASKRVGLAEAIHLRDAARFPNLDGHSARLLGRVLTRLRSSGSSLPGPTRFGLVQDGGKATGLFGCYLTCACQQEAAGGTGSGANLLHSLVRLARHFVWECAGQLRHCTTRAVSVVQSGSRNSMALCRAHPCPRERPG